MASQYEVSGSDECSKIKELAIGQMALQASINNIVRNTNLNDDVMRDSIRVILAQYKEGVKNNYIFKEPMKAYAYFLLQIIHSCDVCESIATTNVSMLFFVLY